MGSDGDYFYYYENETNLTFNDSFHLPVCSDSNLHGSHIFLPLLYYIIFFTGFLGNLFVISVVGAKGKRNARLVDTFVVNLAVADLVFVFTLPLWAISASQNNHWNFGNAGDSLCKLSSYIIAVNRFSNIFFLTCMSIDRYMAVVNLMDLRYLRSSLCIRVTCAAVWFISLLLGIPSLVFRRVIIQDDEKSYCVEESTTFLRVMNLLMALLTFVFPVLIIVLCYGTLIMHLNKHCVTAGNPRAEARRRHSLKMVLCIIVAFVVSWLPFNIFKTITIVWELVWDKSCQPLWQRAGLVLSCCLAFFNSCVNPAIYFFLDHHFKRRAKYMYNTCLRTSKIQHSYNSSASFTNAGTSESYGTTGGRTQLQMFV